MDYFRIDMITQTFGRIYLYVKHRNPVKRRKILIEEYNGSYHVVGREAILWTSALFLVIVVLIAVIMTVSTTLETYAE